MADSRRSPGLQRWLAAGAVLALSVAAVAVVNAAPSVFPTGVTRYDPSRAYNCYVLFDAPDMRTHLIDMDGNQVHFWNHVGFPSEMLPPSRAGGRRGDILVQLQAIKGEATGIVPGTPVGFRNRTVGELAWNGKVVWEWGTQAPHGAARQHHDEYRLANGDTLLLANLFHHVDGFKLAKILDDVIYEVTPAGRIVWRWVASDHLGEMGFTASELALVHDSRAPDVLHLNAMRPLGPNRWARGGDERFAPQNIMISSRNANVVAIIDKKTGRIVWRIGPHFIAAKPGITPEVGGGSNDEMSGQHDAHMIPEGRPGAGDVLIFDNQGEAGYPPVPLGIMAGTRVLEVDPVTKKVVWSYSGRDSGGPTWNFYSSFIGSATRLPNGNTLIDEGLDGRIFQVTPKGAIVWEYVSPYFAKTDFGGINTRVWSNYIYRAQPVPYDWVPRGTPHAERPVTPPANTAFRVP